MNFMSLNETHVNAFRDVIQRFASLSKKFEQVARQLSQCESNLINLINSKKEFNKSVFQKIIEEANFKVSPIELLSQGITSFVDKQISNSVMDYGSDRKMSLLEDKIQLMKKMHSRDTTMSTEMMSELAGPSHKQRIDYEDGFYVGESVKGMRHGQGEFHHNNGNYCSGSFVNDKFDGYGEFFWKNGNIYKGQIKNNRLEGKGVVYFNDGDIYEGEFLEDDKHGQGIFYYKDDTTFNGFFVRGKKHGAGVRFYPNDERYEGLYNLDRRDGKGTYYFKDGTREVRYYDKGVLRHSEKLNV